LRASVFFPPFPSPFSHFFALVPIFARSKSENGFKPAESPTETLATQAKGYRKWWWWRWWRWWRRQNTIAEEKEEEVEEEEEEEEEERNKIVEDGGNKLVKEEGKYNFQ